MLFLLEYDRRAGELVSLSRFDAAHRRLAQDTAFALERAQAAKEEPHEIVLLDAASEEVIRITHARYFETLEELARRLDEHVNKCSIKRQILTN